MPLRYYPFMRATLYFHLRFPHFHYNCLSLCDVINEARKSSLASKQSNPKQEKGQDVHSLLSDCCLLSHNKQGEEGSYNFVNQLTADKDDERRDEGESDAT